MSHTLIVSWLLFTRVLRVVITADRITTYLLPLTTGDIAVYELIGPQVELQPVTVFSSGLGRTRGISFSPDGKYLAACSAKAGVVRVYATSDFTSTTSDPSKPESGNCL